MSFFSDNSSISPGRVEGSAANGLRHRVAVNVERVLDSALIQESRENTQIVFLAPANPDPPYKFISASSTQTLASVSNLTVSRLQERQSFARITCNITIPLTVKFSDKSGSEHSAASEIQVAQDVVMYVPQASVFPFEVKASANCNCLNGTSTSNSAFNVTACITVITKITAQTDLLIPAYGFMPVPNAVEFTNDFFDLPLYPNGL